MKINEQDDKRKSAELAIGRILRMGSRPFQEGDIEEYYRCRSIVLDENQDFDLTDHRPSYARDHNKGAQGQD